MRLRATGLRVGLRAGLRATFFPADAFFTTRLRAAGFFAAGRFFATTAFFPAAGFLTGLRATFFTGFFAADAFDFRAAPGRFLATGFRAFDVLPAIFFAGISLPP